MRQRRKRDRRDRDRTEDGERVDGREDENKSKKDEWPLFLATMASSDRHRLQSELTAFHIAFLEPSYALLYHVY